jgi:hypothetical protein
MRDQISIAALLCLLLSCTIADAQPGLSSIREQDVRKDLFNMADDHFRGREAGTLDELKVSMWLADQARAAGLKPAGDDGTYFQFFSMSRNRFSPASRITIGDHALSIGQDVLLPVTAPASLDAPLLFLQKEDTARADVSGKSVVLAASQQGLGLNVSLPIRRYPALMARRYAASLISRGAAAVIFIADSLAEAGWALNYSYFSRGSYDIPGGPNELISPRSPILWLHHDALDWIRQPGLTLHATLYVQQFEYPSVNVVGIIPGTDPALSKEYVLFSGHQDHDGIHPFPGTDSIYNGADDNASVSVALLAIARAFNKAPGKRSALFVWHGAEERGLLGSRWFAAHTTVPASAITAVLNGDMIGRNTPDSAALLGVVPPHRNSTDLVKMALSANQQGPRFLLDTTYDKASHIEGWYFRSDHLPYARAGIPALFFTSLLHPDYHTPRDEASRIDTKKVTRIAEWMYRTGWKVANTDSRPAVDPGFRLER